MSKLDELVNWLRNLGATVDEKNGAWGSIIVNGTRVIVDVKKTKDNSEYLEFNYGEKRSSSAKNSAVWILSELLPKLKYSEEVAAFANTLKAALKSDGCKAELRHMRSGAVMISFKSLDKLKAAIRAMSTAE